MRAPCLLLLGVLIALPSLAGTAYIPFVAQNLPGVPTLATMDPSLLLDLPCRSGPLFSLNANGDAALLASDGQRWGIYLFPAK